MHYSNTLIHFWYLFLGVCPSLFLLSEHHFPLCCDLNTFPQCLLQLLNALLLLTESILQRQEIKFNVTRVFNVMSKMINSIH